MASLTNKTSAFADHLQRTVELAFEVKVDASEGRVDTDLGGIATLTDAAAGQMSLDLSGLGDSDKALESSVSASAGSATIAASITDGALSLDIDSDQDLSTTDVDFLVKVIVKRSL